jgi:hypothetical protein
VSDIVLVLGIVAAVIFTIVSQVKGESLSWQRAALMPAGIIVFGLVGLAGMRGVRPADVACISAGAVVATTIGLGQGALTHLESRDGALWQKMPLRGLWLWAALIISRVAVVAAAHVLGAHAASSTDSVFLALGINRLAQAAMIAARASRAGLPLAAAPGREDVAGRTARAAGRAGA